MRPEDRTQREFRAGRSPALGDCRPGPRPRRRLSRAEAFRRIVDNRRAGDVAAALRRGCSELASVLRGGDVNEAVLQTCLSRHPLLFGADYREVRSKHRLGAEYELDYALIRQNGSVDLVEIERTSAPLYNRRGDPSGKLVHAEQQVLDWLSWISDNPRYAAEHLPGIGQRMGYVVIGRDSALDDAARVKLRWRNHFFRGTPEILTFDDLLRRGTDLFRTLTHQR